MDNVSIILGYDHAKFRIFPVLIIVHVYPNIPESYSPFSMAQSPAHLEYGNRLRPVAKETTSRRGTADVIVTLFQ